MARAARLSGQEDEEFEELEEELHSKKVSSLRVALHARKALWSEALLICMQGVWTRAKLFVHDLVQRVGFFGILLAASVSTLQTCSTQAALRWSSLCNQQQPSPSAGYSILLVL